MKPKRQIKGCGTALVTPFSKPPYSDAVNYEVLETLINFQIENGVDFLVVAGTTGEGSAISEVTRYDLINQAIKITNNRIPIVIGTGSNNPANVIKFSMQAYDAGADAVLIVVPPYSKPTQKDMLAYYQYISKELPIDLQIIVYNVPSRTGNKSNLLPETAAEIAITCPNIIGLKEACGDIEQISKLTTMIRIARPDFGIYSGEDIQNVPIMELGGIGCISVLSNIAPKDVSQMCKLALSGDFKEAYVLQNKYEELINALFCVSNPKPVKEALNMMGIVVNDPIFPLSVPLRYENIEMYDHLREVMKNLNLI